MKKVDRGSERSMEVVRGGGRWREVNGGDDGSIGRPMVMTLTVVIIAIRKAMRAAGGGGQQWMEVNQGQWR